MLNLCVVTNRSIPRFGAPDVSLLPCSNACLVPRYSYKSEGMAVRSIPVAYAVDSVVFQAFFF